VKPEDRLELARRLSAEKRFGEAAAQLEQALASPEPWAVHLGWLRLGEAHLAQGHLRRALGAFRQSQQTDQRGAEAFTLHNSINAVTTVLLHLGRYFLHVHDEQLMLRRAPTGSVDFAALANDAAALEVSVKPSLHGALEQITACCRAVDLLPLYADQSAVLELQNHGGETARPLVERWVDAQRSLYLALLSCEEPRNHS